LNIVLQFAVSTTPWKAFELSTVVCGLLWLTPSRPCHCWFTTSLFCRHTWQPYARIIKKNRLNTTFWSSSY